MLVAYVNSGESGRPMKLLIRQTRDALNQFEADWALVEGSREPPKAACPRGPA